VASYYQYDLQGSTCLLMNAIGTVTDTYAYDAWGNPVVVIGSTVNPYRYIGRKGDITNIARALDNLGKGQADDVGTSAREKGPVFAVTDFLFLARQPLYWRPRLTSPISRSRGNQIRDKPNTELDTAKPSGRCVGESGEKWPTCVMSIRS
jgi:hypothetical protein